MNTLAGFRTLACAAICLPLASQLASIAGASTINWQGETPCKALFNTPLETLPGGAVLTKVERDEALVMHYTLATDDTLIVKIRSPAPVLVRGAGFYDAMADLSRRQPLRHSASDSEADTTSFAPSGGTVMADVQISKSYSYIPATAWGSDGYMIKPGTLVIEMDAKVRALDWQDYENASEADKSRWDKMECTGYHHELGHILLEAQLFEDNIYTWRLARGHSLDDLALTAREIYDEIGERINHRHDDYHDAIDKMGYELADSRPYLDLPFVWLRHDRY